MPKKPEAQIGPELVVGQRIRQERQAREWTLDTLSRRLERDAGLSVAPSALSMVENGKRRITLNEAIAYAKVFEIDLPKLVEPVTKDQQLQGDMLEALHTVHQSAVALSSAWNWTFALLTTVDPEAMDVTKPRTGNAPDVEKALMEVNSARRHIELAGRALGSVAEQRTPELWQRLQESGDVLLVWARERS